MKGRTCLALAAGMGLLSACAHPGARPPEPGRPQERPSPPPREAPGREGPELGLASYYARSLQGRKTASGARYDGRAMTCAHRSHAFGTVLRVTDLESGRSVLVRVNDRGPFVAGRVVDLSWAAARRLGILERGVARVRVERAE